MLPAGHAADRWNRKRIVAACLGLDLACALGLAAYTLRGPGEMWGTRQSGLQPFIQFHLELDGEMTLHAAHRITEQVERDIQAAFPGAEVMVHADPDSEPAEGLQG